MDDSGDDNDDDILMGDAEAETEEAEIGELSGPSPVIAGNQY
jgi:hypothetical protein